MAETPLSSAELDRLEDALEDLEHEGALERWLEGEPSPVVRERLTDYRTLLAASRDAMPLQDVPAGLLDGVMAKARQAATVAPVVVQPESWWTRLRRSFMVPALALAGTAALVLWIGRPDQNAEEAATPSTAAKSPPRSVTLTFEEEADADAEPASAAQGRAGPAAAAPAPAPEATEQGKLDRSDEDIVQPTEIPSLDPLGDVPEPKANQDSKGDDKAPGDAKPGAGGGSSGRWDIISRGDRARQAGDCVGAREEYAVALEDDQARVRARALAGIGLCDRQDGNESSADANFERARELDGEIDQFIESQSQAKRKSRPKKKRKPMRKSKVVTDPFG